MYQNTGKPSIAIAEGIMGLFALTIIFIFYPLHTALLGALITLAILGILNFTLSTVVLFLVHRKMNNKPSPEIIKIYNWLRFIVMVISISTGIYLSNTIPRTY